MERQQRTPFDYKVIYLLRIWLSCCSLLVAGITGCTGVQATDTKTGLNLAAVISDFTINDNERILRLGITPCQKNVCGIVLQLITNGTILQQQPLKWHTGSTLISEAPVSRGYGAGDPLDDETQYPSWTIGESESDFVVVTVQPFTLGAGTQGLLVHQTAGFEHIRRHHTLFLVQKDRLLRAWEHTKGQGPTWSSVLVSDEESAELIYFEGFAYGDSETADSLTVQYLSWNGKSDKLQSREQGKTPLYYVTVTPFDNIPDARDFQQKHYSCVGPDYLLLVSETLRIREKPGSPLGLTAITHSQKLARRYQESLASCLPADAEKTAKLYQYH